MASSLCVADAPTSVYDSKKVFRRIPVAPFAGAKKRPAAESPKFSWEASNASASGGINLQSLLSLASNLNPSDLELTPVQAWFELAELYGAETVLAENVMEALKREFSGVVKCLHFGAVIERSAFESVVGRVLASPGLWPATRPEGFQEGGWVQAVDSNMIL
jgi:hypothetical protein